MPPSLCWREKVEKLREIDVWWQNFPPTPFLKGNCQIVTADVLTSAHMPIQEVLLRFTKRDVYPVFNNLRAANWAWVPKSNPHIEMQTARVSWLNNEALLRASVPRPRQSRRTNCQGIFLHPDTAGDTGPEKGQVNPLKEAHKGYFQTLSMNSYLELNHRQSLPLVLKDSQ